MTELIEKLANRSMTAGELFQTVEKDWTLLPQLLQGVSSSKTAIRYGCSRVLMDLSEAHPTKLYPFLDPIIDLLDSKYRIITWNALTMIANLARVDVEKKVDAVFDKYYSGVYSVPLEVSSNGTQLQSGSAGTEIWNVDRCERGS